MNLLYKIYQYFVFIATLFGVIWGYYDVYINVSWNSWHSLILIIPSLILIYLLYGVLFLIKNFYDKKNNDKNVSKKSINSNIPFFIFFIILITVICFIMFYLYSK